MDISDYINSIVAFAAIMTSILTYFMIRESRLMRKYYSTPEISIYLKTSEAAPHYLFLHIENLGMGTAFNVRFSILQDYMKYNDGRPKLSGRSLFNKKLDNFYPKQNFRFFIDSLHGKKDSELIDPILIAVSYNDIYGKKFIKNFELFIELFCDQELFTPGETHMRVISYRLEQLSEDFKSFSSSVIKNFNK